MCTSPNQYYPYTYCPPWGSQSATPCEPAVPSLSTTAIQDIVEGQQRTTDGLVSLLSQERTTNERGARDHKQQLSHLTALSQNFLSFMPDVELKFSLLENLIRNDCPSPNNAELQDRVEDMAEALGNLRRFAEGFACSTGLRLVPGLASNMWTWVPANTPPLQPDPTSFSATFPQAPRIFPNTIPNSTRSSILAHSTGPTRSVHWPSDLDAPATTSWTTPTWPNSYYHDPYGSGNAPAAYSRISLGGVRGFSTGTVPGTAYTACPPMPPSPYMVPAPSSPQVPANGLFGPRSPRSPASSVPVVESQRRQCSASSPQPASTPSQTESVVGSMRRTQLSTITESRTPSPDMRSLPAFGRTSLNGPSPSTSATETFPTPSGLDMGPPGAPRPGLITSLRVPRDLIVPNDPTRETWIDMMYPSETSSNASSISLPSPPRVEIPPLHPVEAVQWSSLFPSAPVVVDRPVPRGDSSLTRVSSLDESNASPMLSPARSVISYVDSPRSSSLSEPMTPLSRLSGESTPAAVPNKLTAGSVDHPKESDDPVLSAATATVSGTTAIASTSNASSSSTLPANLPIQLVTFFFETVQRVFKVPASVDLSCNGFEVSFSTGSVPWKDASIVSVPADEVNEHDRAFEIMPAPSNAALHRYIRELARIRMDLAQMPADEDKSTKQAIEQLELRVKAEQEVTQSWVKRVCAAAGALSIVDPAFSLRK